MLPSVLRLLNVYLFCFPFFELCAPLGSINVKLVFFFCYLSWVKREAQALNELKHACTTARASWISLGVIPLTSISNQKTNSFGADLSDSICKMCYCCYNFWLHQKTFPLIRSNCPTRDINYRKHACPAERENIVSWWTQSIKIHRRLYPYTYTLCRITFPKSGGKLIHRSANY